MRLKAIIVLTAIAAALFAALHGLPRSAAAEYPSTALPAVLLNGTGYMLPHGRLLLISDDYVAVASQHGPGFIVNASSLLKLPGRLKHSTPPAILINNDTAYIALYTEKGSIVVRYSRGRLKLIENPDNDEKIFVGVKPCFVINEATRMLMLALCNIKDNAPKFVLDEGKLSLVQEQQTAISFFTPLKPVAPNYGFNASKRLLVSAAPQKEIYRDVKELIPGLLYNATLKKQGVFIWFTAVKPWSPRKVYYTGSAEEVNANPYTLCIANNTGVTIYYAWIDKPFSYTYKEIGVKQLKGIKLVAVPFGCLIEASGRKILLTSKGPIGIKGKIVVSAACMANMTGLPRWLQEALEKAADELPRGPYYAEAAIADNLSLVCINGTSFLLPMWMGVPLLAGRQGVGVVAVKLADSAEAVFYRLQGGVGKLRMRGLPLSYGLIDGTVFMFNGSSVEETSSFQSLARAIAAAMAGKLRLTLYPSLGVAVLVNNTHITLLNTSSPREVKTIQGAPTIMKAKAPAEVTLCSNGSIAIWVPGAKVYYIVVDGKLVQKSTKAAIQAIRPDCRPIARKGDNVIIILPAGGNTTLDPEEAGNATLLVVGQAAAVTLRVDGSGWVEYWHTAWRKPGQGRAVLKNAAPLDPLMPVGVYEDGSLFAIGPYGGVYAAQAKGALGATWWSIYYGLGGLVAIKGAPNWVPGLRSLYVAAGVATPCSTITKTVTLTTTRVTTTTSTVSKTVTKTISITSTKTVTRTITKPSNTSITVSVITRSYSPVTVTVTKTGRVVPILSASMLLTIALLATTLILIRRR